MKYKYELQFLFFFQIFCPKNILFESFTWGIIHMNFVGFLFLNFQIKSWHKLWKYGQILTIQKFLIIKQLRFSKKRFLIWVYNLVLHYILNPNIKFGMWINIKVFILWCFSQTTNPYFFNFKSLLLLTNEILINK